MQDDALWSLDNTTALHSHLAKTIRLAKSADLVFRRVTLTAYPALQTRGKCGREVSLAHRIHCDFEDLTHHGKNALHAVSNEL